MDADDELVNDYLAESSEHLTTIETDLLAIEQAGAAVSEQLVNRVFRAAHSIKGGAGFFDLRKIQDLAHKVENVLDLVRSRQMVPTPQVVSILFSSFDKLRELILDYRRSNDADISAFLVKLTALATEHLPAEQQTSMQQEVEVRSCDSTISLTMTTFQWEQAKLSGKWVYLLDFDLINDVQRLGRTPLQLLRTLMEHGEIVDARLDLESVGTLEDDLPGSIRWHVLYASAEKAESVRRIILAPLALIGTVDKTGSLNLLSPEEISGNADHGSTMSDAINRQKVIEEFLIESSENLARLDQEMLELERNPQNSDLIAGIFRTLHTIKGTCGFLGFQNLQSISHLAENILSQLRDGKRSLTPELVTLMLDTVDAIKRILAAIELNGTEGEEKHEAIRKRLEAATSIPEKSVVPKVQGGLEAKPPDPMPASIPSDHEAAAQKPGHSISDSTIRVPIDLLDKLMNLVGELVLTRNQILQFNARHNDSTLNSASQRLNLITTELQGGVMKTRMQPIGVVWNKLPRLVRDLSSSFDKQIQVEMEGADTELDKTIIEAIKDPITHIVRNSCDHGLEKPELRLRNGKPALGKLTLRSFHEGGQVNIEISDDGAGMDPQVLKSKAIQKGLLRPEQAERMSDREALGIIFLAGFSTAKEITNVSGRGVGMDVVKTNIEKIGGVVDVISRQGQGTTISLKIPLTLAIIPGLVVASGTERFVIPQVSLLELIRLAGDAKKQIQWIQGTPVYSRRGKLLPITYLSTLLRQEPAGLDVVNIVVLQAGDRQFGLVVDGINDTQEIVVKPLGKALKGLSCYAGATIMGDGRVALILDVMGIGHLSGIVQHSGEQTIAEVEQKGHSANERQAFLLFRAGSFERLAVPLSLVARLEEIPQAKIEHACGKSVIQYRDQILPLASLASILTPGSTDAAALKDPAQVVVFANDGNSIGIIVDQIIDIVEDTITVRRRATRRGLLGSALIDKRVTDILDLFAVLEAAKSDWLGAPQISDVESRTVMVVESSAFSQGLTRSCLEMAGYRVIQASGTREALAVLEHRNVDVVVASRDLPSDGSPGLLECMRRIPKMAAIPTLALVSSKEEIDAPATRREKVDDCQVRFDSEAMLRSVAKLAAAVARREHVESLAGRKD